MDPSVVTSRIVQNLNSDILIIYAITLMFTMVLFWEAKRVFKIFVTQTKYKDPTKIILLMMLLISVVFFSIMGTILVETNLLNTSIENNLVYLCIIITIGYAVTMYFFYKLFDKFNSNPRKHINKKKKTINDEKST